ncbi:MAG: S8 family serine peptidase, partial [Candidatus Zixiibacteriota bacterium]
MRRFRLILLQMALLVIFSAGLNAANIDRDLLWRLGALESGETIQALAYLSRQADLKSLDIDLKAKKATLAERNMRVVTALQQIATSTQPDIVAYLEELKRQGYVKSYRMYWIANMFWVDASEFGIHSLSERSDIANLYYNYEIESIKPVESKPPNMIESVEIGLERINAPQVWAQGWTGAGRCVMNIDTGVDGYHVALVDRFRGDVDGDGDYDESWHDPYTGWLYPQDSGTHGTHTMGTICGRSPSGDTVGVAIDAEWIASATIDRYSIDTTIAHVLLSFQWAVDPDGNPGTQDNPDAIGNSWGIPDGIPGYPDCDQTFWTVIDNVEIAGSVVIFSAGNEGSNGLRSPADRATTYFNCFSVGAVDGNDPGLPIAGFSARGPSECATGDLAIKPEVVAPGVSVRSSVPGNSYSTK